MIINVNCFSRLTKLRENLSGWAVENNWTHTSADDQLRLLQDLGLICLRTLGHCSRHQGM